MKNSGSTSTSPSRRLGVLNIHPTGSTLPSSLERTLVIQPDLTRMPDSRYVLIVGNGAMPMFLPVFRDA